MKINRIGVLIVVLLVFFIFWKLSCQPKGKSKVHVIEEIYPERGDIESTISTTGTVQPQNRLEVKPPINGRVEEILVSEGNKVKKGELLARLSSTDRAALLDAARSKAEESMAYWEDVYKPTSLIAPIDGEVIVRSVEPGQTVNASDAIVVLSDRLIVQAQVDETDIGGVQLGQLATVSLDAYPAQQVKGTVNHIAYESKVVSNVTIYEVDILLNEIPAIFKSGMSANIEIVKDRREGVLRLPLKAVKRSDQGDMVLIKNKDNQKPILRQVEVGLENDKFIEIKNGISESDVVVMEPEKSLLPKKGKQGNNPFMPTRPRSR